MQGFLEVAIEQLLELLWRQSEGEIVLGLVDFEHYYEQREVAFLSFEEDVGVL